MLSRIQQKKCLHNIGKKFIYETATTSTTYTHTMIPHQKLRYILNLWPYSVRPEHGIFKIGCFIFNVEHIAMPVPWYGTHNTVKDLIKILKRKSGHKIYLINLLILMGMSGDKIKVKRLNGKMKPVRGMSYWKLSVNRMRYIKIIRQKSKDCNVSLRAVIWSHDKSSLRIAQCQ